MMLDLVEDDTYFYDAEAGDRPVRFIERYLKHFQGRFAGQPFLLAPIQRKIVSELYGFKSRATGFRRFTDVYWEAAIGAGKSPLLAALGLYGLIADGEQGAQVYNFASTNKQARLAVFDTAKKFVKGSPELSRLLEVRHSVIRYPQKNAFWEIVPGTGVGAGAIPHLVLADEAHDWKDSIAYDDLHSRMGKRDRPLFIVATNSGRSQVSFCWRLREKAVAALQGHGDPAIYPIIWAAPADAKTNDPAAWRAANPLMGTTIAEAKVAAKCEQDIKDETDEREFRRLYLSQWPTKQADRWLDLSHWDAAVTGEQPPTDAAVFPGIDLAEVDDLSAVVWVRVAADKMFVSSHFWLTKTMATLYHRRDGVPYLDWAEAGHLTLLDEPTVGLSARAAIATEVLTRSGRKPECVCYDTWRADQTVKILEAKGVACVPIRQGYSLSPGCNELDRRLKERSIVIEDNPVLRFCAENATPDRDAKGNVSLIKPGATGSYEGRRGAKIDGIVALCNAMVQARKHVHPRKSPNPRVIAL